MSAQHPSQTEETGSIWNVINIVLAVGIGGFALFFSVALLVGGYLQSSSGPEKQDTTDTTTTVPAAAAPAPAVAASTSAASAAAPAAAAEITIKPDVSNPLAYDIKEFNVKAGQPVRLTFNNVHPAVPQPHNLCIGKPGTKDKLLGLAMQMAAAPDGMAKGFIPDTPDLLFHTKLLQPNQVETLEFTAPTAGDYPYICTFPGHGILMNGVMKVE